MEIISASSEEVREVLNDVLESDLAQRRRMELSELSFKEWLYNILRTTFAKLGYQLESFEQFWIDVGKSIATGWEDGRRQAREEAELRRRMRERRYR